MFKVRIVSVRKNNAKRAGEKEVLRGAYNVGDKSDVPDCLFRRKNKAEFRLSAFKIIFQSLLHLFFAVCIQSGDGEKLLFFFQNRTRFQDFLRARGMLR